MKYKFNIHTTTLLAALAIVSTLVLSCTDDGEDDMAGVGKNYLRLITDVDAETSSGVNVAIAAFPAVPGSATFLEIRRDAISNAALNQSVTVNYEIDNTIVDDYNAYIERYNEKVQRYNDSIPEGIKPMEFIEFDYNVLDPTVYNLSGTTVTFEPGEFVKYVPMEVDPATLSFEERYALGVRLTSPSNGYVVSNPATESLVRVVIRNQYDGTYAAKGTFYHPTAGARPIDELKELATQGPNTVLANLGDLGGSGYQMLLTIHEDNSVTIEPAGATPNVAYEGPNTYDPAKKEFTLNYSYNTAAPRVVRETLTLR